MSDQATPQVRGSGMLKQLLVLLLAVFVAEKIIPGVTADGWTALIIACLVLAILNTFLRPLLLILSLPLIVVTLGLFFFVLNAAVLALTAWIVPGFHVTGFWPALGGALVITIVNIFFGVSNRRVVVRRSEQKAASPPAEQEGARRIRKDDDIIDI